MSKWRFDGWYNSAIACDDHQGPTVRFLPIDEHRQLLSIGIVRKVSDGRLYVYGAGVEQHAAVSQERLEDLYASAIAYHALTGSVEGFPVQELDL